MLEKLERKLGRYAIANLPVFLVGGQAAAFLLSYAKPEFAARLTLIPNRVMEGEVWRLATWVFTPQTDSIIFIIFELWLLLIFGRALEAYWGAFRFNVFFLIGFVLSIGSAFLVPSMPATNVYLMASIFLAFCYLNPDFELLLFFILPVKIKWFGYITWVGFAYMLVTGGWIDRAMVAAGTLNFFVFFGKDIWLRIRGAGRRQIKAQQAVVEAYTPTHKCAECGLTDLDDPLMQFRYCSKCTGQHGYCKDHLKMHEHKH